MKRQLLAGVAVASVLAAGCSSTSTTSTTSRPMTTRPTTSRPTTTTAAATTSTLPASTTTTAVGMIRITEPVAGATVSNPIVVSGSADVYEAVLFIELRDASGAVLATQRLMASSGTGTPGTFSGSLSIPAGAQGAASVAAYSLSAKDGSKINQTSVPVILP